MTKVQKRKKKIKIKNEGKEEEFRKEKKLQKAIRNTRRIKT